MSLRDSSVQRLDGRLLAVLMDNEPARVDDSVEWAQGPKLTLESLWISLSDDQLEGGVFPSTFRLHWSYDSIHLSGGPECAVTPIFIKWKQGGVLYSVVRNVLSDDSTVLISTFSPGPKLSVKYSNLPSGEASHNKSARGS